MEYQEGQTLKLLVAVAEGLPSKLLKGRLRTWQQHESMTVTIRKLDFTLD
jgi:hypothetical protein